jgi:hypothetical protein
MWQYATSEGNEGNGNARHLLIAFFESAAKPVLQTENLIFAIAVF